MHVFIDESGDPGFKLDAGSSPIFVTSMVIFRAPEVATETGERIAALRQRLGVSPEFKFNKCKNDYKDAFFQEIRSCSFRVRSVVVQKELIRSPALRSHKESFYKFFVKMMMKHDGGALHDAKVLIDGSGDRPFKKQLRTYLRRNLGNDVIRKVELRDSRRDPLIQLADMTAGAIARSYKKDDRRHHSRWREMLRLNQQLEDVWEFK